MTNYDHGITADGAKILPATAYKVVVDTSNAKPLQVTGGMSVSGATTTGSIAIGTSGDVVNGIKTYTSTAANIAATNVLVTQHQIVNLTVTGVLATDAILSITPTNAVANQVIEGNVITAANNVSVAIFSAVNTNAATGQTFAVKVIR